MNVYQLNPVQVNTNTEVGEVVFVCTYINISALKMLMFHWKHVQLIFCTSNVVITCKLTAPQVSGILN